MTLGTKAWKRKLLTILWIAREQGLYKLLAILFARVVDDRWLFGKLVEIQGNAAHLDGCVFNLDSPYIPTRLKGRFWTRTYEAETRYLVRKHLPDHLPVIELGGCLGVISCLTNRRLVNPRDHMIVEANKYLLTTLETNRINNGCEYKIVNAALAYGADVATLYLTDHPNTSSLIPRTRRAETVPAVSLQTLLENERYARIALICGIEGAELALVETEGEVIRDCVEWFLVETHDFGENSARIRSRLVSLGFQLLESFERTYVFQNRQLAP